MKILWFTNTPCRATEKLTTCTSTSGGWLRALSENILIDSDIELHIAFYWEKRLQPFEYEGVIYHPVLRKGNSNVLGRYLHRLRSQFSSVSDNKEVKRLLEIVEEVNPDIIHIHGSEENFGMIAPLLPEKKIVLSVQGLLSPILGKRYAGIPLSDIVRHESLFKRIMFDGAAAEQRRNRRAAKREQTFMPYIQNILGRTAWDKSATLALNPHRRYFMCNEILRREFYEAQWTLTKKKHDFTLVTIVSNGFFKGLETIYRSAALLTKNKVAFQWKIIGLGVGDAYVKITEKHTQLNAKNVHISFEGRKSASEIVQILIASDLYCNCSHIENSPNSVCEAMLLGMPVVASNVGGTSSLLNNYVEGLLVQPGDPYSLTGTIMTLKENPLLMADYGKKARERALQRHNASAVCQQVMECYNILIRQTF